MDNIHIELVSQEKKVFEELTADMVLIPAIEGIMGVYPNHAPTIATLGYGELVIRKGNAEERFAVFGGVVDVRPGKVVVLAELAESSYAIDVDAAEKARANAEKLLREGLPPEANRDATLALRRASLELQISRNLRQRGPLMRILGEDEKAE
ncbi:MAG TPA: ATP synthase F1 subunit epsilon [Aggregatilineales bacterium]|nr:ATP synthase F1 subunit epsilon [Aggregatilineales bacterium]